MTEVSLMVLPAGHIAEAQPVSRPEGDPPATVTFYMFRHGSWHEVSSPTLPLVGLERLRDALEELLKTVMQRITARQPGGALVLLQAKSQEWWNTLVPDIIKQALTKADEEAKAAGTVPRLLVNAHQWLEWLPWELLHDGDDYLGLKFQVARLPIVANGSAPTDAKFVTRAVNLLGTQILSEVEGEAYHSWASTFDPFQPLGVAGRRLPPGNLDGGWPTLDDLVAQKDADIIHITAHGDVDENGRQYLALDLDDRFTSSIDDSIAALLAFPSPGPLVFCNACGSVAAGDGKGVGPLVTRGLGVSFFDRGAAAYIGSLAPLGTEAAIRFAATFYRFLLQDQLCVGEALRQAKLAEHGKQDPSYLFYCLYGLPGTKFVPAPTVAIAEQPPPVVAPADGG